MLNLFEGIQFNPYEMVFMRLFLSYVIFRSFMPKRIKFDKQPRSVGIARFVNLGFLSNKKIYSKIRILILILFIPYSFGYGLPIVTLILCFFTIAVGSLYNSQGAISHERQVISITLLAQSLVYLIQIYKVVFSPGFDSTDALYYDQLSIYWSQQAVISAYFTSGLTKIIRSNFMWINQVQNIPVELEKTAMHEYYNTLDASRLKKIRSISKWMLGYPFLAMIVFSLGLFLELLSPLSLINRITNLFGGLILILFHRLNNFFMRLPFSYSQRVLLIYFINVPFWIVSIFGVSIGFSLAQ